MSDWFLFVCFIHKRRMSGFTRVFLYIFVSLASSIRRLASVTEDPDNVIKVTAQTARAVRYFLAKTGVYVVYTEGWKVEQR